ncbi:TPA: two-component system sensor histidine kinase CreC [Salmonella enterica subsp. salamae serovar 35:g,m,s,t:-]|nr:two-component system sensor histidine kinase CreC [Salmonella enterica subsp. salamae serovar 35:g,m,s,t:-]HCA3419849.1 two-component system sensor histidine kinase CreC [Salmonella enterica subsp. salamae serovar 35:g,m,s,t:-]HCA3428180.1 two-component system sensor histidine kinase CreC [Salmonella enterica subsp. salamae serovar 35:g,m,s,t:-]HCA3438331.1 two-component system sensor histidine kinase CreC [Salmonella enterica subsp. salamae serovar 35:g,m,s,t:-]HCA3443147.1 two-component sy
MRIGMRLLLGYFLIVAVAAVFVLSIFVQEIKPGVRRATEGTLIDTATLLAALARDDLLSGHPTDGHLAKAFAQLQHRPFRANISGITKVRNEYHVYMTDAQGKVLFDSENSAAGQDYSRWNDVWLTLRGQYGARSTAKDPADPESAVMYVAAPILSDGRMIGVLTVGKPNAAMAPVIKRSERRILWASALLLGIALAIGAGMVWWINRSIARLTRYADSVTENRPLALPALGSSELRKLAQALESMRIKLEGKNDIEQYVYALTHELKSPLAAIRGAAELLAQALGNLLDNAIDFTPENGVITLSAQPMGEKAILQVTDSGCGIPDFALSRIFDRFYSLPRENGRKSSGLGLAFVSEAARLLNGEVALCNRTEGGVLASLTLHRHFT